MMDKFPNSPNRPANCRQNTKCTNIRCVYEGWDSETWECKTCGCYFTLYYEDMK